MAQSERAKEWLGRGRICNFAGIDICSGGIARENEAKSFRLGRNFCKLNWPKEFAGKGDGALEEWTERRGESSAGSAAWFGRGRGLRKVIPITRGKITLDGLCAKS